MAAPLYSDTHTWPVAGSRRKPLILQLSWDSESPRTPAILYPAGTSTTAAKSVFLPAAMALRSVSVPREMIVWDKESLLALCPKGFPVFCQVDAPPSAVGPHYPYGDVARQIRPDSNRLAGHGLDSAE